MRIVNNVVIKGSNEPIFLKSINLNSLRVVEIQEAVNVSVFNDYYTFDIDLSELDIIRSETDVLLFKNFTSNDENFTNALSELSDFNICVFVSNLESSDFSIDILKNNCIIEGVIQYKFPEQFASILGLEYYSEAILSKVLTLGATVDARISDVSGCFKFFL